MAMSSLLGNSDGTETMRFSLNPAKRERSYDPEKNQEAVPLMIEKKFYVNREGLAMIVCPSCGKAKPFDVAKLPPGKMSLRVKCPCGTVFKAVIELRKHYRKETELIGSYKALDKDDSGKVIMEDISLGGMRLQTVRPHDLVEGDTIEVNVTLDSKPPLEITRKLKVLRVQDRHIGCRYVQIADRDPDIGFYLMA